VPRVRHPQLGVRAQADADEVDRQPPGVVDEEAHVDGAAGSAPDVDAVDPPSRSADDARPGMKDVLSTLGRYPST
jgi:hypothetical protein